MGLVPLFYPRLFENNKHMDPKSNSELGIFEADALKRSEAEKQAKQNAAGTMDPKSASELGIFEADALKRAEQEKRAKTSSQIKSVDTGLSLFEAGASKIAQQNKAAGFGQQSSKWAQNNAGKGYTGLGPYYEKKDAPKQEKKFK